MSGEISVTTSVQTDLRSVKKKKTVDFPDIDERFCKSKKTTPVVTEYTEQPMNVGRIRRDSKRGWGGGVMAPRIVDYLTGIVIKNNS